MSSCSKFNVSATNELAITTSQVIAGVRMQSVYELLVIHYILQSSTQDSRLVNANGSVSYSYILPHSKDINVNKVNIHTFSNTRVEPLTFTLYSN